MLISALSVPRPNKQEMLQTDPISGYSANCRAHSAMLRAQETKVLHLEVLSAHPDLVWHLQELEKKQYQLHRRKSHQEEGINDTEEQPLAG